MLLRAGFLAGTLLAVSALATSVQAANGISIPEPSDLSLFALGVVGLIVGRHAAKRRK